MALGHQSRRGDREETAVPVNVSCDEGDGNRWKQSSLTINVSPFGARFRLAHPTEPGRLIHLALEMPRRLRCYDHDVEPYRTWALVRHVHSFAVDAEHLPEFEIGVAFTGKTRPAIHESDPAHRFKLDTPESATSPWSVKEVDDASQGPPLMDRRAEPRHEIADDVVIEIYDADGTVYAREATKTQNISRHGMAVLTTFQIVRGRYVRIRSAHYRIAVIAAVRRVATVGDGRNRLHLEFVDQQWPPLD